MNVTALLIQIVAGAIAANAAGNLSKHLNLGPLANTIAGLVGGGIGGRMLDVILGLGIASATNLDIGVIGLAFATGALGGGVAAPVTVLIKNSLFAR
jgi:uncharacterized membrane protein YeaQ/YmgE (transglycosylase-associated protein family)